MIMYLQILQISTNTMKSSIIFKKWESRGWSDVSVSKAFAMYPWEAEYSSPLHTAQDTTAYTCNLYLVGRDRRTPGAH